MHKKFSLCSSEGILGTNNMNVLLDTNIFLSDLSYSKPEFEALKNYLETTGASLLIPNTVDKEVRKNIKTKSSSEYDKLCSLNAVRLELLKDIPTVNQIEATITSSYETYIEKVGNIRLEDKVSLDEVVERSLRETPPFKTEGKGLRDALVWYNLIDYLRIKTDDTIAFISNNSSDFGKDELKPELKEELASLSLFDKVHFFNSLNDFLDEFGNSISFIDDRLVEDALKSYLNDRSFTGLEDELKDRMDYHGLHISDIDIIDYDYDGFDIENYYIYHATSKYYYVYSEVALYFSVLAEIYNDDFEYDAYTDNMRLRQRRETKHKNSYLYQEYSLKISKSSHKVEAVEIFDGVHSVQN